MTHCITHVNSDYSDCDFQPLLCWWDYQDWDAAAAGHFQLKSTKHKTLKRNHNNWGMSSSRPTENQSYLNCRWPQCAPVYQSGTWVCGLAAASSPGSFGSWPLCSRLRCLLFFPPLSWCWSSVWGLEDRKAGGDTEGPRKTNPAGKMDWESERWGVFCIEILRSKMYLRRPFF